MRSKYRRTRNEEYVFTIEFNKDEMLWLVETLDEGLYGHEEYEALVCALKDTYNNARYGETSPGAWMDFEICEE